MLAATYLDRLPSYPATRPIRVTEPTFEQEPLSMDECRDQLGLTGNESHDRWIKTYLVAARDEVENDSGITCYTGAFTWNLTHFPASNCLQIFGVYPVTAITSITYVDTAGATQTWSSAQYALKNSSLVPLIELVYGYVWPVTRWDIEGIRVNLTAGYATVAAIPSRVKAAVRLKLTEYWKLKMGEDAEPTVKGYERQIDLIGRRDYA